MDRSLSLSQAWQAWLASTFEFAWAFARSAGYPWRYFFSQQVYSPSRKVNQDSEGASDIEEQRTKQLEKENQKLRRKLSTLRKGEVAHANQFVVETDVLLDQSQVAAAALCGQVSYTNEQMYKTEVALQFLLQRVEQLEQDSTRLLIENQRLRVECKNSRMVQAALRKMLHQMQEETQMAKAVSDATAAEATQLLDSLSELQRTHASTRAELLAKESMLALIQEQLADISELQDRSASGDDNHMSDFPSYGTPSYDSSPSPQLPSPEHLPHPAYEPFPPIHQRMAHWIAAGDMA